MLKPYTAWKVSKHGVISGLYLPVFSPNTGKHGPEITSYLDTVHAVLKAFFFQRGSYYVPSQTSKKEFLWKNMFN